MRLTGKGLGITQSLYLPEAYTVCLPIIIEEIGAIGGLFIIFLYGVMLYKFKNIVKCEYLIC